MNNKKAPKKPITKSKTFWIVVISALVILAASIAIFSVVKSSTDYVAKVGKQTITKADFNFYMTVAKQNVVASTDTSLSSSSTQEEILAAIKNHDWEKKTNGETEISIIKKKVLESVTWTKIQVEKAKDKGISLTADEQKNVDANIDAMVTRDYSGSKSKVNEALGKLYNINLDDYKNIIIDRLISQKYKADYETGIKYTDADLKKAYEKNKKSINKAKVQHILIKTLDDNNKEISAEKLKAAKKKAEDILAKAEKKEDFAALVKKYTEDLASKDTAGVYSMLENGRALSDYENATLDSSGNSYMTEFASWPFLPGKKVGDFGLVKTSWGYHIMHLLAKNDTYATASKQSVQTYFKDEKFNEQLTSWAKESKYAPDKNNSVYDSIK